MIVNINHPNGLVYQLDVFDEDKSVASSIQQTGFYEPHIGQLLHYLGQSYSGDFLDIGANFGQHSIGFAKLFPEKTVTCFEGSLENCEKIWNSVEINNLTNIEVINALLGDPSEEVDYYFWKENAACAFVSKSDYGNKNHPEYMSKTEYPKCLDNILTNKQIHYDIIKIDIEGSEKAVLTNSPKTFMAAKAVVIEINNFCSREFFNYEAKENIEILNKYGFQNAFICQNQSWTNVSLDQLLGEIPKLTMIDVLLTK